MPNIFAPAPVAQTRFGLGVQLSADGFPKAKPGACMIHWPAVTALTEDTRLPDAPSGGATGVAGNDGLLEGALPASDVRSVIPAGSKVIRYGTAVMKITAATDPLVVGKFVPFGTTAARVPGGTFSFIKGDMFLINETVVYDANYPSTEFAVAIDGGRIFKARILLSTVTSFGTQTDGGNVLVTDVYETVGPTLAQVEAALPNFTYAVD